MIIYIIGTQYLRIRHPGKDKSLRTVVFNGYISNHNKMQRPCPKFKVSFYLHFCCFWINVTQINFGNIKQKLQRIICDSCFQLKSWFNVDAWAPSIPLLNFPFKWMWIYSGAWEFYVLSSFFLIRRKITALQCRTALAWVQTTYTWRKEKCLHYTSNVWYTTTLGFFLQALRF